MTRRVGYRFADTEFPTEMEPSARLRRISEQKLLALEWLCGGGTVSEAAQYAGVRRQTVSRWLHHDADFRSMYQQSRQKADGLLVDHLVSISESAFERLKNQIRDNQDSRLATSLLRNLSRLSCVD